jgi:transcription initiation factor TFIIE subunit alpha
LNNGKLKHRNLETDSVLLETVGEEGLDVVQCLLDKEETDEKISEETGLRLNTVRKILYRLYDYRLASYVRTKDKDIGWYTYTWKLNLTRMSDIMMVRKKHLIGELHEMLDFERDHVFFRCCSDAMKYSFDAATETGFRCPSCDSALEYVDNQRNVTELEKRIKKLEREINQ